MTAAPGAQPPPGWPGPGPSPLTQAGVLSTDAAWRRGAQQAAEDARGAVKPDITTPFQGFGDAAQRLTAFHVFGTEEGDEQDLDELGTCRGPLCSATRVCLAENGQASRSIESLDLTCGSPLPTPCTHSHAAGQ